MELQKECINCGQAFEPTCHITRQKYCCDACRNAYNNAKRYGDITDICPECGDKIEQTGERGRRRRYCSDRCRVVYNGKKRLEAHRLKPRPWKTCPNCGIDFEVAWGSASQRRFCCDSCRIEWWKEYHKANPKDVAIERKCVQCGREYGRDRWHGGEYCSRECYLRAMAETRVTAVCEWCGEEFSAYAKSQRKYCGWDCSVAAHHKPGRPVGGKRHISYHDPEEWREQIRDAARKAGSTHKRGRRVWLVCGVTSMYASLDVLLGTIRYQLNHNPFDGGVYVFCDSTGRTLKYLEWDGSGFCIGKRRAQSGTYPWPPMEAGAVIEITEKEFEFLRCKSIVPFRTKKAPRKRCGDVDIH